MKRKIDFIGTKRGGFRGDSNPIATVAAVNTIRFSNHCTGLTDIDKYKFALAGKDADDDKILYFVLSNKEDQGQVKIRKEASGYGYLISATRLIESLSYDALKRKYYVSQEEHEGKPLLILKLIEDERSISNNNSK